MKVYRDGQTYEAPIEAHHEGGTGLTLNGAEISRYTALQHMCLAAYLSDKPAKQIKKMAKRYSRKDELMQTIVNYKDPAYLVLGTFDQVNKELARRALWYQEHHQS